MKKLCLILTIAIITIVSIDSYKGFELINQIPALSYVMKEKVVTENDN